MPLLNQLYLNTASAIPPTAQSPCLPGTCSAMALCLADTTVCPEMPLSTAAGHAHANIPACTSKGVVLTPSSPFPGRKPEHHQSDFAGQESPLSRHHDSSEYPQCCWGSHPCSKQPQTTEQERLVSWALQVPALYYVQAASGWRVIAAVRSSESQCI